MGVSPLDNLLGGLVVGTWVNSMLLAIQFLQVYKYFRNYPRDPVILRVSVGLTLLLNVECIIGNYANVYMFCVSHWGNADFVSRQYWPTPNFILTSALTAVITQGFLTWRFWRLSGSYVISAFLMLVAFTGFGGAIALTVVIVANAAISQRSAAKTTATIWFVGSAAADVTIAVALIWQFRRMRSFFDNTRSLLRRLTVAAVRSGTVTSTVALTAFFLYLANNQANWATGVVFMIGPVYALTMLSNLNARRRLHGMGQTSDEFDVTSGRSTVGDGRDRRSPHETFAMSGIHVVRTVQLNDDQNQNLKLSATAREEIDSLEDRKQGPLRQVDASAM